MSYKFPINFTEASGYNIINHVKAQVVWILLQSNVNIHEVETIMGQIVEAFPDSDVLAAVQVWLANAQRRAYF